MPCPFQFRLLAIRILLGATTGVAAAFPGVGSLLGSKSLLLGFVVAVESWFLVVYSGTVITRRMTRK